ncbi:MAG TPA: tRNA (adenosine(37)-N6)-threonylcarbamoyltransferase complex ATPase subunit type 1 TsaE [Microbacteriaceae bacterium]|nr:tRNA (adenosine(37)-N6)-threonylcarbamoyltransferase complex ATPase subunit type 1 TsaE [Microbacteriaceae bacterium]
MRVFGTHTVPTGARMESLGEALAALLLPGDIVLLTGPLGAGKTTLTRGIGRGLGVRGPVTSPTFVLARTHPSLRGGPPLVHVDAYRLSDALELDDLDLDFARSVTVVEWGAGLLDGIAESWLDVVIDRPTGGVAQGSGVAGGDDLADEVEEPRLVTVRGRGPRWRHAAAPGGDPS